MCKTHFFQLFETAQKIHLYIIIMQTKPRNNEPVFGRETKETHPVAQWEFGEYKPLLVSASFCAKSLLKSNPYMYKVRHNKNLYGPFFPNSLL